MPQQDVPPTSALAEGEIASPWPEIIRADDATVEIELLNWSGLAEAWERCQERWARTGLDWHHDFVFEVAESCSHIFIGREEWDGGAPGQSGLWHTVETDDPVALRQELRGELAKQLRSWRVELWRASGTRQAPALLRTTFSEGTKFFNVNGVPVASTLVRGWGGYGSYSVRAFDIAGGRTISREAALQEGIVISQEVFDSMVLAVTSREELDRESSGKGK